MLQTIRQGLLAGLCAGFIAALLFLVDYGPGNSLHAVASWLGLDSSNAGRFVGFALMLVLGVIFGVAFAVLEGRRQAPLGRALGLGLLMGLVWWVVVVFGLGVVINHVRFDFRSWLASFIPLLVYGSLLGSLSFQWRQRRV